ncbi:MAG TPA: DUF2804 family protein [Thermoleophilaceae bacterium]|nr:DUF2804 family protein [Thermoleophilaceae bacterium]
MPSESGTPPAEPSESGTLPAEPSASGALPRRGPGVRELGLPLPPARMPALRAGRPLKRWLYAGVYAPEVMLCVGDARVAGLPQRWWAVALPDGRLFERTTQRRGGVRLSFERVQVRSGDVSIELELGPGGPAPVEVVSPHERSYIWTAKRAPVQVRGHVVAGGERFALDSEHGFIDHSAGYHARHTSWRWSAGVGRSAEGRSVAWNLVEGVHDALLSSERTVWVDGVAREIAPQSFAADLAGVGGLSFRAWASREHSANRGLLRTRYRQPFGEFKGRLPGGVELAEGFGVMEEHEVWW